jgi:hypothetical protein
VSHDISSMHQGRAHNVRYWHVIPMSASEVKQTSQLTALNVRYDSKRTSTFKTHLKFNLIQTVRVSPLGHPEFHMVSE